MFVYFYLLCAYFFILHVTRWGGPWLYSLYSHGTHRKLTITNFTKRKSLLYQTIEHIQINTTSIEEEINFRFHT